MDGKAIFEFLKEGTSLEAQVETLADLKLAIVMGYLARGEEAGWLSDLVHGVCISHAVRRFSAQTGGAA